MNNLLVARADFSTGGDADKLRSQHQFEPLLIALGDRIGPAVFDLLHLAKLGRLSFVACLRLLGERNSRRDYQAKGDKETTHASLMIPVVHIYTPALVGS